ncbi:MAG: hypothetical protein QOJ92_3051, partial [Frankiales bacterium]|nr:hypothetical protein [Frankiales bacterium]
MSKQQTYQQLAEQLGTTPESLRRDVRLFRRLLLLGLLFGVFVAPHLPHALVVLVVPGLLVFGYVGYLA